MRPEIVSTLRGHTASSLELRIFEQGDGHVREGLLEQPDGRWFPIIDGVPSFLQGDLRPDLSWFEDKYGLCRFEEASRGGTADQAKTNVTFSDKWRRFTNYGLDREHQRFLFSWYCEKLGLSSLDELEAFYRSRKMVLEVGPGSGFNASFISQQTSGQVFALDISEAAFTVYTNTRHLPNCHAIQGDLMAAPFEDETFDLVFADGVLHHTPDTKAAVFALYEKLKPGGQFFFYVYRKMGAARQFTDRHIREHFTQLDPDACYEQCEGFTELGRELSALGAKITLERGIPLLGIPPGVHDVQRLVYYNFLKCFWNDAFDFDTNNMVNFDWYHPHNAWQHTREEVEEWLRELGAGELSFQDANPNGLSVLVTKPEGTSR